MKKETKNKVESGIITGVSSAVGAAAGVAVSNVMGAEPSAEDVVDQEAADETRVSTDSQSDMAANSHQTSIEPETVEVVEEPVNKTDYVDPAPQNEADPNVTLVGCVSVADEVGNQVDVAVVDVAGQEVDIIDVDQDGEGDLLVADFNHNGVIEPGEMTNIQGEGLAMPPVQNEVGITQADMPDCGNDADLDTYNV